MTTAIIPFGDYVMVLRHFGSLACPEPDDIQYLLKVAELKHELTGYTKPYYHTTLASRVRTVRAL